MPSPRSTGAVATAAAVAGVPRARYAHILILSWMLIVPSSSTLIAAAWSPPYNAVSSRTRLAPPSPPRQLLPLQITTTTRTTMNTALRASNKDGYQRSDWKRPWKRRRDDEEETPAQQQVDIAVTEPVTTRSNRSEGGGTLFSLINSATEKDSSSSNANDRSSVITRDMEEEVAASARASMDRRAVSRAIDESLKDDPAKRRSAFDTTADEVITVEDSAAWTHQQVALASGITAFVLSPLLLQWLTPFHASFQGSALLGTTAYILAMGDPLQEEGVGGAVSRIVGRSALRTADSATPRIKAAARAAVSYPASKEEAQELQDRLEGLDLRVTELAAENAQLRREVALRDAVEDASSRYRLEDLREKARGAGLKVTRGDTKLQLLRKLVRAEVLELDLGP